MNGSKVLIVMVLLINSFLCFSQTAKKINWSGSIEDIKNASTSRLQEEKDKSLTFEVRLFELNFNLEYIFDHDGKLSHVLYYRAFSPEIANCVVQYNNIKSEVVKEHGEVKTVESIYNDKIETSANDLCKYVATGEYKLETDWQRKPENVNLIMSTWKGTPYIGLSYSLSEY